MARHSQKDKNRKGVNPKIILGIVSMLLLLFFWQEILAIVFCGGILYLGLYLLIKHGLKGHEKGTNK